MNIMRDYPIVSTKVSFSFDKCGFIKKKNKIELPYLFLFHIEALENI